MEAAKCVICFKPQVDWKSIKKFRKSKESHENFSQQLRVIFIIRRLLRVPSSLCEDYLRRNGNPFSWIQTCSRCTVLVDEAFFINSQINRLQEQLHDLSEKLRNEVRQSHSSKFRISKGKSKNDGLQVTHSIRNFVIEDRISSEDEEKYAVLQNTSSLFNEKERSDIDGETKFNYEMQIDEEFSAPYGDDEFEEDIKENVLKSPAAAELWLPDEVVVVKDETILDDSLLNYENSTMEFIEMTPDNLEGDPQSSFQSSFNKSTRSLRSSSSRNKKYQNSKKQIQTITKNIKVTDSGFDIQKEETADESSDDQSFHESSEDYNSSISSDSDSNFVGRPIRKRKNTKCTKDQLSKPFPCDICDTGFSIQYRLTAHRKHVHGISAEVDKRIREQKALLSEQRNDEISDESKNCDADESIKISSQSNKMSKSRQNDEDQLKCFICDQVFLSNPLLVIHRREAHNYGNRGDKPPFSDKCEFCEKKFTTYKNLCTHRRRVHNIKKYAIKKDDPRPWKCFKCKLGFPLETERDNHEIAVHKKCDIATPLNCILCDKSYRDKIDLCLHYEFEHRNKVEPTSGKEKSTSGEKCFRCDRCLRRSRLFTEEGLKIHIRNFHELGQNPNRCKICGLECGSKSYLRLHSQRHTGERLFKCEECSMTFKSSGYLKAHKIREHSKDTEPNPLRCEICNKIFSTIFYLRQHKSTIHDKIFRLVCHICGYGCKHDSILKRHMLWHDETREKNHKCPYEGCTSTFTLKTNLNYHIGSKHTEIKRFPCSFCSKGFGNPGDYKRHVLAIHSGKTPFKCNICQRSFPVRGYLFNHMKHKHKLKSLPLKLNNEHSDTEPENPMNHMKPMNPDTTIVESLNETKDTGGNLKMGDEIPENEISPSVDQFVCPVVISGSSYSLPNDVVNPTSYFSIVPN